jgi:hypothetical protein
LVFLSWGSVGGRPTDISRELGGTAWTFRPALLDAQRLTPLRWAVQAVATAAFLLRRRPRAVIATNPPIWLGLIALAYCKIRRAPLVLDSHPGGFGAQKDRVAARVQGLHRFIARHCAGVLVTTEHWANVVRSWGGTAVVLWEAPVDWSVPPLAERAPDGVLRVLYIGVFGDDEPVETFVAAMNTVSGVEVSITGDQRRAPAGLIDTAAAHISFVGYLRGSDYADAVAGADLLVSLTEEPTSVMRSGCEAVWAERPLLVTDSPATREAFPYASHAENTVAALASAVERIRDHPAELASTVHQARVMQEDAWQRQADAVTRLLGRQR